MRHYLKALIMAGYTAISFLGMPLILAFVKSPELRVLLFVIWFTVFLLGIIWLVGRFKLGMMEHDKIFEKELKKWEEKRL